MPREFQIPRTYRSELLSQIKQFRNEQDPRKKDKSPTVIKLDGLTIKIARHFGFCFGVENAIEIAYRALEENPEKKIYLLSEMIHNPQVNGDLEAKGIKFLFSTYGEERIPLSNVTSDDIVVVPAFGTTCEIFDYFKSRNIDTREYNTTCPFVEKVWKRAKDLGQKGFSLIIHGKHRHEETRATFSHATQYAPSLVISGIEEATWLADYISGNYSKDEFSELFAGRFSDDFHPLESLARFGVVNQTTMLATETREISQILRAALVERYGESEIQDHFADTRDTLCYATSENQDATKGLIDAGADLSIVVGGYNSSNTSHLVELCDEVMPSYFVKDADELISMQKIRHLNVHSWDLDETENWLKRRPGYREEDQDRPIEVLITAGASCPDALVYTVILKLLALCAVPEESFTQAVHHYFESCDNSPNSNQGLLKVVSS